MSTKENLWSRVRHAQENQPMLTKAYSVQADIEEYKTSHAKKKVQNPYYLAWKPIFDGREMQDEIALKNLQVSSTDRDISYAVEFYRSKKNLQSSIYVFFQLQEKLFIIKYLLTGIKIKKIDNMKKEKDMWNLICYMIEVQNLD